MLIVNLVTEFRVSIFQQLVTPTSAPHHSTDLAVERIIVLGFESKAFCLFALLFGVGLAILFDRLSQRGRPLYWLVRRLAVLLALGLIHLLLVWNGDILTEYALAGFVALLFLRLRPSALLIAASSFLALYVAVALSYSPRWPNLQTHVALANQVYSTGSLREIWLFSLAELRLVLPLHVYVFPRTLALFLFGMYLWKTGILRRASELRYEYAAAAVAGITFGAILTSDDVRRFLASPGLSEDGLAALAPVPLALGYGAALMASMQVTPARRFLSAFAPIGRMAFTNYLMQSLIFGFIFFGYGLGQFGRMGAATAFVLGVFVYMAQLMLSRWWLQRYRLGPIEWLWRTLMYGVAQPMVKSAPGVDVTSVT